MHNGMEMIVVNALIVKNLRISDFLLKFEVNML